MATRLDGGRISVRRLDGGSIQRTSLNGGRIQVTRLSGGVAPEATGPVLPAFVANCWESHNVTPIPISDPVTVVPDSVAGLDLAPTGKPPGTYQVDAHGNPYVAFTDFATEYLRAGLATITGEYALVQLWDISGVSGDTRYWGHDNIAGTSVPILRSTSTYYQAYVGPAWNVVSTEPVATGPSLIGLSVDFAGLDFWAPSGVKTRTVKANTGFPSGASDFGVGVQYSDIGTCPLGKFYGQWTVNSAISDAQWAELRAYIVARFPGVLP